MGSPEGTKVSTRSMGLVERTRGCGDRRNSVVLVVIDIDIDIDIFGFIVNEYNVITIA